jgi:hypothetical protein
MATSNGHPISTILTDVTLLKPDGKPDTNRVRGLAGTLIAARDYRRRYPNCLLVSVDSELARLWLRLSRHGERCDLLALRLEGDELVVETIEVKTCGRETVEVSRAELDKALKQLVATLEAVRSGLNEGGGEPAETSPLAAPRQEMLKEVFVTGCQSLAATPADRTRWAEWLRALFREGPGFGGPRLNGLIYAVELGNNSLPHEVGLADDPFPITLRSLREAQIQELISGQGRNDAAGRGSPGGTPPAAPSPAGGGSGTLVSPAPRSPTTGLVEPPVVKPAAPALSARPPADPFGPRTTETLADHGVRFCVGESLAGATPTRFFLHPSNTKLNQLNIGVVGDLGPGKTQLTKALIYQFSRAEDANRGHRPKFLIFDYKRDYTKPDFVEAFGARVIQPHHIPLNIFDLGAPGYHLAAARLGRVMFLNDCLHRIYGGIGPKQRNQMKTAVLAAYEQAGSDLPSLPDVLAAYETVVGERIDAPYSILSYLADLEVFVPDARDAVSFRQFFDGVLVIDLASLGIGEKERNMLVVLFLNFFYEYMKSLEKRPYIGDAPQLRFIDSMLLVDEADNIMKCNFEVLRQILLQGREFGVGALLASQYLSHFKTREMDYTEPLLTWFIHKVPNVTARELEAIGLTGVGTSLVERVKTLDRSSTVNGRNRAVLHAN